MTTREQIIQAGVNARQSESIHISEIENVSRIAKAAAAEAVRVVKERLAARYQQNRETFLSDHDDYNEGCMDAAGHAVAEVDALLSEIEKGQPQETDHCAALLRVDPSAAVKTEALPNGDDCNCAARDRLAGAEREIARLSSEVKELNGYLDRNGL